MSYEPTNWKTGDVVTSAKLNKLENGVAGASSLFVVHSSYNEQDDTNILDCTVQELLDVINDGKIIIYSFMGSNGAVYANCGIMTAYMYTPAVDGKVLQPEKYEFIFVTAEEPHSQPRTYTYIAHSLDEYPVQTNE